jgi:thioredoxin reductase (NADPH)
LFATFYAGMRQMSVKLIDSLPQLGGQLTTLYPEKLIYDVPGFPAVRAKDLAANLIQQAFYAQPQVVLSEQVQTLEQDETTRVYTVQTDRGSHQGKSLVIAAGIGAFSPKRLPLPEAAQFEGRGLHYSVSDPEAFRDKRVLIVGGGDSAVDWANTLAPLATQTFLVHRRDVFRAHEASVAQLHGSGVQLRLFCELQALHGRSGLEQAIIRESRSGQTESLAVDAVLVSIGFESSLGPLKDWGLQLRGAAIEVGPTMQTNRRGIFAIGDVCSYDGKLKLIANGFGEAATAVNFAKTYIDPSARAFPGHSTSVAEQRLPGLVSSRAP